MQHLLPRHLQIIFDINLYFLQYVERNFPKEREMLGRVSIIEESNPKMVRMRIFRFLLCRKLLRKWNVRALHISGNGEIFHPHSTTRIHIKM